MNYLKGLNIGFIKIKDNTLSAYIIRIVLAHFKLILIGFVISITSSILVVYPNELMKKVINSITYSQIELLKKYAIFFLAVSVFSELVNVIKNYFYDYLSKKISNNVQKNIIKKLLDLPFNLFDNNNSTDIFMRQINSLGSVSNVIVQTSNLTILLVSSLTACYLSFRIDPLLTIICFVIVEPIRIMITKKTIINKKKMIKEEQNISSKYWQYMTETISNVKNIKLFNLHNWRLSKINNQYTLLIKKQLNISSYKNKIYFLLLLIYQLIIFSVMLRSGIRVLNGYEQIGDVVAIIAYFKLYQGRINIFFNSLGNFQNSLVKIERSLEIISNKSEEQLRSIKANGNECINNFTIKKIEFKNVSFKYISEHNNFNLRDINFEVNKGQILGIAGLNGSGKSSIIKLLTALYRKYTGEICYTNVNLDNINAKVLRQKVGVLLQNPVMYAGTVRENILCGTEAEEDFIRNILYESTVDTIIKEFEKGLETILTEKGSNLSGGQRKRIALARVLATRPEVLILDEPYNDLDTESQIRIKESIIRNKDNIITIIISHRTEVLSICDEIILLKNGEVVEKKTQELLDNKII